MNYSSVTKELNKQLLKKQQQIAELYILIDTLQTNLRSAVSHVKEVDRNKITTVPSYKWCVNWKSGDELK